MKNERGPIPRTVIHSTTSRGCVLLLTLVVLVTLALPATAQLQTYNCNTRPGFGEVVVPPVAQVPVLQTLKDIKNPVMEAGVVVDELLPYIQNAQAAVRLGKALYWDMQVGSDNKTACATCHHHAGADSRARNQRSPGKNGTWDALPSGANRTFAETHFPFFIDDAAGSQGVRAATFKGFSASGAEMTESATDTVFKDGAHQTRRVTGVNSPTVINAVFNHRNFWNGRAQPDFNGVNVWGSRDGSARVWTTDALGNLVQTSVLIPFSSLASQAVGPPLDSSEMSAAGRNFAQLGRKMLSVKPLGLQTVSPADSVLGTLAETAPGKGLKTTYTALIQAAIKPKWWRATRLANIGGTNYTLMQANFSLIFGLAVMMYEATLVSDDSPMDRYLETRMVDLAGNTTFHEPALLLPAAQRIRADWPEVTSDQAMIDKILAGLALFEKPVMPPPFTTPPAGTGVGCMACHLGPETTTASVNVATGRGADDGADVFKDLGFDLKVERMFFQIPPVPVGTTAITFDPATYAVNSIQNTTWGPAPTFTPTVTSHAPLPARVGIYDTGWYNIGVRPDTENLGLGGLDAFGKPLSWVRLAQTSPNPGAYLIPGEGLGCIGAGNFNFPDVLVKADGLPLLSGPLTATEASPVDGSFKVPGLRNVELTGPYLHNGGLSTLMQVTEFYDDGGNFTSPSKAPLIRPLMMTEDQRRSLVAFMMSMTDDRVRLEKAPFDRPSLDLPDGQDPVTGADIIRQLPAVGATGGAPLPRFLSRNPFALQ